MLSLARLFDAVTAKIGYFKTVLVRLSIPSRNKKRPATDFTVTGTISKIIQIEISFAIL